MYSMPNVTTYIRKDDMGKWLATPNKAELIHNALNKDSDTFFPALGSTEYPKYVKKEAERLLKEEGRLTKTVRHIGENYIGNPKAPDILKQGKGGRYGGDSPILEEELIPPKSKNPSPSRGLKNIIKKPEDVPFESFFKKGKK